MGLTTILTTIGFVHRNTPKCKILIFKENWTPADILGQAADVWGSRVASSNLASPTRVLRVIRLDSGAVPWAFGRLNTSSTAHVLLRHYLNLNVDVDIIEQDQLVPGHRRA
jgi:hypothetical protein